MAPPTRAPLGSLTVVVTRMAEAPGHKAGGLGSGLPQLAGSRCVAVLVADL